VIFMPMSLGRLTNSDLARYAIEQDLVILTHDKTFYESVALEASNLLKRLKLIILSVSPGAIELCMRLLDQFLEDALYLIEERGIVMITPEGVKAIAI